MGIKEPETNDEPRKKKSRKEKKSVEAGPPFEEKCSETISKVTEKPTVENLLELKGLMQEAKDDESSRDIVRAGFKLPLVAALMTHYNARLTPLDLAIYDVISAAENLCRVDFNSWSPLVFGEKSADNYKSLQKLGTNLHSRVKPAQVLEYFDAKDVWTTILHMHQKNWTNETMYDERFMLRLLSNLLGPGSEMPRQQFVESNALSLAIVATSSRDANTRKAAYFVLQRFLSLLNALAIETFDAKEVLVFVLRLFKQSVEQEGQHVPNVITQYLARVVKLALRPDQDAFPAVMSYLFQNAGHKLLLDSVPDLPSLLFSSSTLKHKEERNFILDVIRFGCCEHIDFEIIKRRGVLASILSIFSSPLTDQRARIAILDTLKRIVQLKKAAHDLIHNHGLAVWIALQMQNTGVTKFEAGFLGEIFMLALETDAEAGKLLDVRIAGKKILASMNVLVNEKDVQATRRIEELLSQ